MATLFSSACEGRLRVFVAAVSTAGLHPLASSRRIGIVQKSKSPIQPFGQGIAKHQNVWARLKRL
jgi:hypothetical protein